MKSIHGIINGNGNAFAQASLKAENVQLTERIAELENILALAGARQREDGVWVWPYYRFVNKRQVCEWLETDEWKQRRKDAANAIAIAAGVLRD